MKNLNHKPIQFGLYRPYSPNKSPLRNLSPMRKQKTTYCETTRIGNLSPLRKRKNQLYTNCKTPSKSPVKNRPTFTNIQQQSKRSQQTNSYMESTIKKKCGLFRQILKKKQQQQELNSKHMIQTTKNNQNINEPKISFSELSQRKKRGSVANQQITNNFKKNYQNLIYNVKEIESIQCSKAQKNQNSTLSVKNNQEALSVKNNQETFKQIKIYPQKLNQILINSFGTPKHSELIFLNNQKQNIKDSVKIQIQQNKIDMIQESFGDVNSLLRKISQKPIKQKQNQSEDSVQISAELQQYNFNMSPDLS